MATETIRKLVEQNGIVDITSQCSTTSGSIQSVVYTKIGNVVVLSAQINNIVFSGSNIWVKLPDSFPGSTTRFASLATAFAGMVCVFRIQAGVSGKFLLVQCSTNGTYNLTATGVCFA